MSLEEKAEKYIGRGSYESLSYTDKERYSAYIQGYKDCSKEMMNPFPIENKDLQSRKEYYFDEELRYFNDLMNKQEEL